MDECGCVWVSVGEEVRERMSAGEGWGERARGGMGAERAQERWVSAGR